MNRLTPLIVLLSAGCAANPPAIRLSEAQARNSAAAAASKPAVDPSQSTPVEALTPRQAMARELQNPLPRARVESPEAFFRGEVLAAGTPEVNKRPNGVVILTLPIGTATPITCFFHPEAIDAGATAKVLIESLLEDVKLERVRATDVKAFANSPALFLEADFVQDDKVGRLKMVVHADPVLPKTCFHDEMGYVQTFQRVTESLATGLSSTAEEQPVPPYFSDVQVMRVNDVVLGFQYAALFHAKSGGTVLETNTTMVRPGTPATLQYQDTSIQEWVDDKGVLQSKSYHKRLGQEITAQVRAERQEDGSYGVEGSMGGKDVKARLSGELLGEVGIALRVRDGLLKGGAKLETAMWIPPSDASAPTRVVVSPRAGAGPRSATMEMNQMSVNVEFDVHGFTERMEAPAGGASFVTERISQTGTP
ncbi:hypothetical protein [Cystobacter ferrugineus]|nr:hypothetical protein [Cystobacter ferrugineus]